MSTHTCSRCKVEQPIDQFYDRGTRKREGWVDENGTTRSSQCRTCNREKTAKWRELNNTREWKDKCNRARKEKNRRIKDAVFGAYGGYRCACCGETEPLFLSIDHVNNDGARMRREMLGHRTMAGAATYAWLHRHNYPAGYQVLCMNCQHGKRMNHGVCPHHVRRRDYPLVGVGASAPKRIAPLVSVSGEEIVRPAAKVAAGQ